MVGTLIRQPNEKYCIVNFSGDVSRYNLTEQDIINMYIEDAKACIGTAEHYGELITKTIRYGCTPSDDVLKAMGFDKSYQPLKTFLLYLYHFNNWPQYLHFSSLPPIPSTTVLPQLGQYGTPILAYNKRI